MQNIKRRIIKKECQSDKRNAKEVVNDEYKAEEKKQSIS